MTVRLPLSELAPGDRGVIAAVDGPEGLRKRLAALGFRAGRAVVMMRRGSLCGPLHVRLGTTDVALRPAEAAGVSLRPTETAGVSLLPAVAPAT
ncbi:MAG: ferrous iron transport protein A [Betaproteobacteria bacterium]|nr:ferrous iron transport protein A [Betaproteobacteria bacterium]